MRTLSLFAVSDAISESGTHYQKWRFVILLV